MFAGERLDLIVNHGHLQVMTDVFIADVLRFINHASKYFILERLEDFDVRFHGASPELDTISPRGFHNLLAEMQFVLY